MKIVLKLLVRGLYSNIAKYLSINVVFVWIDPQEIGLLAATFGLSEMLEEDTREISAVEKYSREIRNRINHADGGAFSKQVADFPFTTQLLLL